MFFVFLRDWRVILLSVCTVTVRGMFSLIGDFSIVSNDLTIASCSTRMLEHLLWSVKCNWCMYVIMCVCMYVCMHVCMYVCMYVCVYVFMYVCMHVFMYVEDLLRSVSIYGHFTWSPKYCIALSRLPVNSFSRNFALRTQRTFATYVLKFVDISQEVRALYIKSSMHILLYLGYQRRDFQDGLHLACDSHAFHTL